MAYTKTKRGNTAAKKATQSEPTELVVKEDKTKKFSPEDMIRCVSITPGELFVVGRKSGTLYSFMGVNDVVEIEFRDLDQAARSKDVMMLKPRYIVQDKDFVKLHPFLDKIYSSMTSAQDLKNILKLSPNRMKAEIKALPEGAKDSLRVIAATMVDDGELDSVQRVKALDDVFGTDLLVKLVSNE